VDRLDGNTSRGCGSNVSTAKGASGRAACAARMTLAWTGDGRHRKLPSATVAPRASGGTSCQFRENPHQKGEGARNAGFAVTHHFLFCRVLRCVAWRVFSEQVQIDNFHSGFHVVRGQYNAASTIWI